MSAIPNRRLTAEEFLAWERASDTKHEYFDGDIIDFAGTSLDHARILQNIAGLFYNQLRGGNCQSFSTEIRVRVGKNRAYTYPDVVVICGEPQVADDQRDTVLNPTLIIEVLSPSTALIDRVKKFDLYTSIPTLQEYVLIHQDRPVSEQYVRQAIDKWLYTRINGLGNHLALPSLGCTLAMTDIYERVVFAPEDSGEDDLNQP
ncbi:MAG: Uma2 family endonuclease [Anaerolineae bacterium]|nr:Uma2 family endonuclease [Anaerolineae bacterium]